MVLLNNLDGAAGADNTLGPYETWLFDLGKHFDLPAMQVAGQAAMSCVAEFAEPVAPISILTSGRTFQNRPDLDKLGTLIPPVWRNETYRTRFLPFIMRAKLDGEPIVLLDHDAAAMRGLLVQFRTGDGEVLPVSGGFRINLPVRAETLDTAYPVDPGPLPVVVPLPADQPLVIMAVIDHGIPLAHRRLRGPDGRSRVDYAWAQAAPAKAQGGGQVLFGREVRGDEVDALVLAHGGDEEAVYRRLGLLSQPGAPPMPLDRLAAHGAHVADLMAGGWPEDTAAQVRVIAVDLPGSAFWETAGFGKDMFLLAGLHYIFERADRIAAAHGRTNVPLIINLSYGHSCGPQDGSSMIEEAMEDLIAARRQDAPTDLIMPSGNMRQDRLLARLTNPCFTPQPAGGHLARLHWFVPPSDRTSTYLEMWLPAGLRPDQLHVRLFAPDMAPDAGPPANAANLPMQPDGLVETNLLWNGRIVGQFSFDLHRNGQWRAMLILCPTELPVPDLVLQNPYRNVAAAPAGTWTIEVDLQAAPAMPETETNGRPGGIHCRIQRDVSFGQGRGGARQSRFLDPAYAPFDAKGRTARDDTPDPEAGPAPVPASAIRRLGTMNGLSTALSTTVVTGRVGDTGLIALYSGAGSATRPPAARPPIHWTAPSDRSAWLPGIVAAGTRSGVGVTAQGTSCAAPVVARMMAMQALGVVLNAEPSFAPDYVGDVATGPV